MNSEKEQVPVPASSSQYQLTTSGEKSLQEAVKETHKHTRYSPGTEVSITEAYKYLGSTSKLPVNLPSEPISPVEHRKNQKLAASKQLAFWLWGLLATTALIHLISVVIFSAVLVATSGSEKQRTEPVTEGIGQVNETAKTLYAFIGPLVAAVTGYYFSASENENSDS